MGEYQCAQTPDEPIVLHLTRVPLGTGSNAKDQFNAGKRDLLATSFETFERNIRDQLTRLLGPGDFDAARDIAGITVNRWPHGYAYGYLDLWDSEWEEGQAPHEIARQPIGNITIANCDAAASAYTQAAIEEAFRAVDELN